jgi:hypothetical protein
MGRALSYVDVWTFHRRRRRFASLTMLAAEGLSPPAHEDIGAPLTIEDYDYGPGNLCSYLAYVADLERDR